ncbi:CBS domain-containing protein [Yinghuangia seranimata]|uniref:CBS domain-containing protein n=1 Tax=Yinghuangia seranimata TaxID=408067 RepID=UPI00248CDAFE|nr:CBS domain-containing protein [Yinghuangia seranimata]MDI2129525.1 CBS domain-containing protein [Yinghuangia seranimata]
MQHHRVDALMTTEVATVHTDTPFKEIVRVLGEHHVSAVPVLDQDKIVVGVVSEADLLRKEADSEGPARLPLSVHTRRGVRAARGKAEGETAADLMSSPAVTIDRSATVGQAARTMEQHGVKRLPVTDRGRLCGIVSRCDLLRVFLQPDDVIRVEILDDVIRRDLWIDPATVTVRVTEGVVHLEGELENKTLTRILVRMCRGVDGVVQVHDHLTYAVDDTKINPADIPRPGRRL